MSIRTSLPGFLGIGMALRAITATATRAMGREGRLPAGAPIHWDAFLEAVAKEAALQHLDDWNESEYVKRAEALARRLDLADDDLAAAFERAKKGVGNGRVDFDPLEKQQDLQFQMTALVQTKRAADEFRNGDMRHLIRRPRRPVPRVPLASPIAVRCRARRSARRAASVWKFFPA